MNTVLDSTLGPIPHQSLFGKFGRRIKKLGLRRVVLFPRLCFFLFLRPKWRGPDTVLYTTDPGLYGMLILLKGIFSCLVICECHGTASDAQARALAQVDLLVFTTEGLRREFFKQYPECGKKSIVAQNAVDVEAFERVLEDKVVLRRELELPEEKFLVGYIGRFEPLGIDKGLRLMLRALPDLPEHIAYVLVGGSKEEIEAYTRYVKELGLEGRVLLVPYVESSLVPRYAKVCDALVYVPSKRSRFFEEETSPMKLFEYMAARRPIIVSAFETTRSVLNDTAALFIEPGDLNGFIRAVTQLTLDPKLGESLAHAAHARVEKNTWRARVERIMGALH